MGAVKSDIEIARSAKMQPIQDILAKINVATEQIQSEVDDISLGIESIEGK